MPAGKLIKVVEGENQESQVEMKNYSSVITKDDKPFQYSIIKTNTNATKK